MFPVYYLLAITVSASINRSKTYSSGVSSASCSGYCPSSSSLVCIFLFKNRKLQYRLAVLDLLLSIGWIVLQYFLIDGKETTFIQKDMLVSATYLPAAFIPIPVIILLFLAARGVRKDEKLIKSLDRLR